ncbi:MAG TPA: polysaccharide pyruvyl transferase CsaB [Oscillatoriaceae cyanobacterium]
MLTSLPRSDTPSKTGSGNDPLRIVLSGYYGYNNLGDEAILAALVQQLRALAPDAELLALSGNPADTRARLGIEAVNRLDVPAIWRTLRRSDLFVSGGGSLLQDVTGLGSVPYYLGLVGLAQFLGVRTMVLGQGVGPLNLPTSRMLVGSTLRRVDAVTVRDQSSRELLARCGVPIDRVGLTADPVLAMEPASPERVEALRARLGLLDGQPTIAVAIRPWHTWFERQLKAFSAVLAQHAAAWNAQILLLPFHRPDDELLAGELRNCLETRPDAHRPHVVTLEEPVEPELMLGLISRVDLMIGMRLHALIMAAAVAVPALALVYDPKVEAFADRAGFPSVESVTALEASNEVSSLLDRLWEHRAGLRLELQAKRDEWRALALSNAETAIALARTAHAHHA